MPIRDSAPVGFVPVGLSDAIDQSSAFPGACQVISNLIFDRENRGAIVGRPANVTETTFPGFDMPGVVSVMFSVGSLIYGMISSNRTPNLDEPFCYDTANQVFIPVSGITANNCPVTQPTTGEWTPPTMAAMGIYVIVTHPGFQLTNFFGWFDVTNPAAPVWNAGNTTVNLLPAKPIWVREFFGRAYFGVDNAVYFTDSLSLAISNTNFAAVLTLEDKSPSTGAAGLPMSQTSGAILQSLIVFKGTSIWQVSGDIALTNNPLSLNRIALNVGCVAPRTIQTTPLGIIFIANDGPRQINLGSVVGYLQVHGGTPDIVSPFATATYPSRMVGCYSNGIYRVCLDGTNKLWDTTFQSQDYWYDFIFNRWNGPHTFSYHCAVGVDNVFYLASNNVGGSILKGEVAPNASSVYQELGNDILCELVSSAIEGAPMTMSCVVESTIELGGAGVDVNYYISMYDDRGNNLAPATIKLSDVNPLWGQVKWGQFRWRSSIINIHVFTIPWTNPVVFKKMILSVRVMAAANVSIKASFFRVQTLGYTNYSYT